VDIASHWDTIYATKHAEELSWFQREPSRSIDLIGDTPPRGAIVDIGAGTSSLVDSLIDGGWEHITLLDLAPSALEATCCRLADRCGDVELVTGDVTTWEPTRSFDVWHDRAVFHFLRDADRDRYVQRATAAITSGGRLVLATFATDGPETCSGLPTQRYDASALAEIFAGGFTVSRADREVHVTPWGSMQSFTWVVLTRVG
jgi:2-polyprenyl-3-methyl-5-hydroxy-6-metoxy-1,4-benzoquinol methylase